MFSLPSGGVFGGRGLNVDDSYGCIYLDRLFQIYIQNYWWLRSPYLGWDDSACLIFPSGVVYSNYNNSVTFSYGRTISPDLTYPDAYYIDRGGDTYSRYYVTGSYGRILSGNCYKSRCIYCYNDGRRWSCWQYIHLHIFLRNILISSHDSISSLCRIAGLREFVFQLFYFHKGA